MSVNLGEDGGGDFPGDEFEVIAGAQEPEEASPESVEGPAHRGDEFFPEQFAWFEQGAVEI